MKYLDRVSYKSDVKKKKDNVIVLAVRISLPVIVIKTFFKALNLQVGRERALLHIILDRYFGYYHHHHHPNLYTFHSGHRLLLRL